VTGAIFGLFHANVGSLIAVERIVSSTFLGLVLGWICWRTGSVFPGMVLHVLHNALMLSLVYFGPQLQAWGWDIEGERYLPLLLVLATTVLAPIALVVVARIGRIQKEPNAPTATEPLEEAFEAEPKESAGTTPG
jgi:ABC-2 type transport system permease protein/sodium transport system permease protein